MENVEDEGNDSENESQNSDDAREDDNYEVRGDDSDLSEIEDEMVNDEDNQPEEEAAPVNNAVYERESPQETLFKGIDTVGMRAPLQSNPNLTAIDHLLLTLSQAVRHNDTYERIIDSLKWIKKSFQHVNVPTTKAGLWATLGRNKENLIYRLFCSKCKDEVGEGAVVRRICRCGRCGPESDQSFIATFIQIRLRPQLMDLLSIRNMAESLRYKDHRVKQNDTAIEDIYDGQIYKELSEPGKFLFNNNNFSLTLWTDGIQLTQSSRATTYPVILQLNELSPHSRKQHLLLVGLWVADEHPIMNTILRPIVRELRELYNVGIAWRPNGIDEIISRFIVIIFTADSVARPDVLRMKRFNGLHGCTFCLAPGQMEVNTWIYPAREYMLRTDHSLRDDALSAVETEQEVNGVKGVSALANLPLFDMVDGVVVDSCHNAFLGVSKRLVNRFLTDVEDAWYIGQPQQTAVIDERLLRIKTPTRISRKPRSILLYRLWKASEWRNWLLYYAPSCLDGILPREYLDHLKVLSKAIYILNSSSITEVQLNDAEDLLRLFVEDYERLYGLKNMVFNVHLLTHCVRSVRNWGPLWVYSALPFEALNRKITDYITSPHGRADQIVSRFFMKKFIVVAARQIPVAEETKKEIYRLLKLRNDHVQGMPEAHYFRGIGNPLVRNPEMEEVILIREAGNVINVERHIAIYNKADIHGTEYKAADEVRRKYCNHIAFCRGSRFFIIEKILYYTYQRRLVAGIIGRKLENNGIAYGTSHMQRVVETEERSFVSFHDVICPGILITSRERLAVSLCNVWETD